MRHLSRAARWALMLTIVVSIVVPGLLVISHVNSPASHPIAAATPEPTQLPTPTAAPELNVIHSSMSFAMRGAPLAGAPAIKATAGILVDIDTGEILWERNPHMAMAPASTTKIMTALVALNNFSPDEVVTVSAASLHQQYDETRMAIHAGEQFTVRELVTGMMMVSANDAATALAVDTVGRERFIRAMNNQEAALGLHDSHFSTPVGLDAPDHHISPYDMAAIATAAVDNEPLFRDIVGIHGNVNLPANTQHRAYALWNINLLMSMYPAAVGIKPGYTGDAGACLVSMAVRNGHRLIAVIDNAPLVYSQSRTLLDWGFSTEGLSRQYPPPTPKPTPTPSP